MSDKQSTPQFTSQDNLENLFLSLSFDEFALQRLLNAVYDPKATRSDVPLTCVIYDSAQKTKVVEEIVVDASRCPKKLLGKMKDKECRLRTFFYLNGLLNVLKKVRMRYRSTKSLTIETDILFLQNNASEQRVYRWKKGGYKGFEDHQIQLRELWNEFYAWCSGPVAFHPLQVIAKPK